MNDSINILVGFGIGFIALLISVIVTFLVVVIGFVLSSGQPYGVNYKVALINKLLKSLKKSGCSVRAQSSKMSIRNVDNIEIVDLQ